MSDDSIPPPEGEVDEFESNEREVAEILASLVEFVSQETAGETPSVNNEDQCEEVLSLFAGSFHGAYISLWVRCMSRFELFNRRLRMTLLASESCSQALAMPAPTAKEDHVEVETHEEKSPGKPDYVMVNPCAHFPPTSMVDVVAVPSLDQDTYQTAVVVGKGPVLGLGTSSGAFTHKIDPTLKGKAASETSQTLKSKGEDCS
ncbi:hypothetical protein PIB30_037894 [Stylosanthes scabra]|uniref:Uncharacterized protein n=1 Tax=Stylosanthes scabra TaxID=79078 RepID=A0ABU6ZCR4_9FABA|nr:hypothetical protein [Stylosanthes scabra]